MQFIYIIYQSIDKINFYWFHINLLRSGALLSKCYDFAKQ